MFNRRIAFDLYKIIYDYDPNGLKRKTDDESKLTKDQLSELV